MKAILQRVTKAKVEVDSKTVGEIGTGFLILLGVENGDTEKEADALAAKIAGLRIFTDENDKMNLALADVNGSVLVISNFTLCADCSHTADALILWLPQDLTQPIRSTNISAKKCTITELSVLKREFSVPI